MIALLADENFRGPIVRGIRRRTDFRIDIVRAQDVGLLSSTDQKLLEWAAENRRVVLTHDAQTLIGFAFDRVKAGLKMPGLLVVAQQMPTGQAIDQIILTSVCSEPEDFDGQTRYLPI